MISDYHRGANVTPSLSEELRGRCVLVTGGTGSFGKVVARELLADDNVAQVRIFSRDEAKQDEMRRLIADERVRFYIGDVRDYRSVEEALRGVDHVFHAAALKQVPSCEFFPMQAVATNVEGSDNVIRAAHRSGVQSVVCLSTDKAVYPINAMGMSKAMMEKVAQSYARNTADSGTVVAVVRYGNVMYSRGSVIPLFVEQIRAGQPMTVTDPTMTRFLMSIDESVDLVRHAFTNATPGDIFVRKAPAATIGDLAQAVAKVMGAEPDIRVIGTRHAEKLFEALLSREETVAAEDLGDYYRVPLDARSLDYGLYVEQGNQNVGEREDYTSHNTQRLNVDEVVELLRALPEMQPALAPS